MIEEKKDKKNIIIVILLVIIVILSISFVIILNNNKKELDKKNDNIEIKDNNTTKNSDEIKEVEENVNEEKSDDEDLENDNNIKSDDESKEETTINKTENRFIIPKNDSTVLFAGSINEIKEKRINFDLGKKWDNQIVSLGNGVNAEISCLSYNNDADPSMEICNKIKIQINRFVIYTYDQFTGCGDGNYIIVTKDHLITHKVEGCGTAKGIEMDNGIIISEGPTTIASSDENDGSVYISLNDNKLYYREINYKKSNNEGNFETKVYAYDINTKNKEVVDTYFGPCSGQC